MDSSVPYGGQASSLPSFPPLTIRPDPLREASITDITEHPLGRELQSLLAWFYGTGFAADPWPYGVSLPSRADSPPTFALSGYDRRAVIVAIGQYDHRPAADDLAGPFPPDGHVAVHGTLEGSPPKAHVTVLSFRATVMDHAQLASGWHVVLSSATRVFSAFYDPRRRLLWRYGDARPSTRRWRVPHLDEVTVPRSAVTQGLIMAPAASSPADRPWWQERGPQWTRRHAAWLDQARDTGTLVIPYTSPAVPDLLFRLWRAVCDRQHRVYSVLYRARGAVSTWRYNADPQDLDRFRITDAAQQAADAYFVQRVVPEFAPQSFWLCSLGHFGEVSLPTRTALTHISALLDILTAGRQPAPRWS
ncbi:hypothetical protein [Sulfobacillus sp. hq2]|uniref:hypothetical protein n=1 Tax=Sulfobacillus sp. hq2 TaxID=2039167 RepID=UPI000CD03B11|nr:hypothetical protein [Sulfobacillus sp. hq2]POB12165.1 hypothetical protein CO251_00635 [Sulfobacillus sp. hq2]